LVLSNRLEYGPYSLVELQQRKICSTDKFWCLNKSHKWQNPQEITALNEILKSEHSNYLFSDLQLYPIQFQSFSLDFFVRTYQKITKTQLPVCLTAFSSVQRPDDLASVHGSIFRKNKFYWLTAYTFGFLVFSLILMGYFAIVLMHKMSSAASATTYHLPTAKMLYEDEVADKKADFSYQNAIGWDMVAVDTAAKKPADMNVLADWKKYVKLTSELKLNIRNNKKEQQLMLSNLSPYHITDAIIEVQFLNDEGKVLAIEEVYLKHILPGRKRILPLIPQKEGIQFKHRLKDMRTKEKLPELVEI
jgi:hypothetical protein